MKNSKRRISKAILLLATTFIWPTQFPGKNITYDKSEIKIISPENISVDYVYVKLKSKCDMPRINARNKTLVQGGFWQAYVFCELNVHQKNSPSFWQWLTSHHNEFEKEHDTNYHDLMPLFDKKSAFYFMRETFHLFYNANQIDNFTVDESLNLFKQYMRMTYFCAPAEKEIDNFSEAVKQAGKRQVVLGLML